jgi:hypothetical protein
MGANNPRVENTFGEATVFDRSLLRCEALQPKTTRRFRERIKGLPAELEGAR